MNDKGYSNSRGISYGYKRREKKVITEVEIKGIENWGKSVEEEEAREQDRLEDKKSEKEELPIAWEVDQTRRPMDFPNGRDRTAYKRN